MPTEGTWILCGSVCASSASQTLRIYHLHSLSHKSIQEKVTGLFSLLVFGLSRLTQVFWPTDHTVITLASILFTPFVPRWNHNLLVPSQKKHQWCQLMSFLVLNVSECEPSALGLPHWSFSKRYSLCGKTAKKYTLRSNSGFSWVCFNFFLIFLTLFCLLLVSGVFSYCCFQCLRTNWQMRCMVSMLHRWDILLWGWRRNRPFSVCVCEDHQWRWSALGAESYAGSQVDCNIRMSETPHV